MLIHIRLLLRSIIALGTVGLSIIALSTVRLLIIAVNIRLNGVRIVIII